METTDTRFASRFSPSMRWSIYAGVYAFLCSTVLLLLLYPIRNTLVKLLGLPTGFSAFLLAGPVAVIGAVVWWAAVERRDEYTYPLGAIFGSLTAVFTVLFWVLVYTLIWGPSLVLIGGVLVVFVLVVAVPVASISGMALMYVRRRLDDGLAAGKERAPERTTADE